MRCVSTVSGISVLEHAYVVSHGWTALSCEFKRVGGTQQSSSWLRHSNPCAPNHTAVLSARGNASESSLWSWYASHSSLKYGPWKYINIFIESLTNCTWTLNSMTHNERAIRRLSLWLWTKCNNAAFSICKPTTYWFLWPRGRTSGMSHGHLAHLNTSAFPASFVSSVLSSSFMPQPFRSY